MPMLIQPAANRFSNMLFYFEIRLSVPPDFQYPPSIQLPDQSGRGEMITAFELLTLSVMSREEMAAE